MGLHVKSQFNSQPRRAYNTITQVDRISFLFSKLTWESERVLQKNERDELYPMIVFAHY